MSIYERTYTIYSRFSQHSMYCRFLVGFHVFFFVLSFIIPAKTGKMSSFFMSSFRNERKIRVTAFFSSLASYIFSSLIADLFKVFLWACSLLEQPEQIIHKDLFFTFAWASFLLSDNACLRR